MNLIIFHIFYSFCPSLVVISKTLRLSPNVAVSPASKLFKMPQVVLVFHELAVLGSNFSGVWKRCARLVFGDRSAVGS